MTTQKLTDLEIKFEAMSERMNRDKQDLVEVIIDSTSQIPSKTRDTMLENFEVEGVAQITRGQVDEMVASVMGQMRQIGDNSRKIESCVEP